MHIALTVQAAIQEAPVLSHVVVPAKRSSRQAAQAADETDESRQHGGISQEGAKPSSVAALGPLLPTEASGSAREEGLDRGASEAAAQKLPKTKKLARQVLAAAAQKSLPLKAFKAELWGAARDFGAVDRKAYVRQALAMLSDSKQFLVTKKAVSLVSQPGAEALLATAV